jgi:CRISPR-associated endonuclease/helicase Cas3
LAIKNLLAKALPDLSSETFKIATYTGHIAAVMHSANVLTKQLTPRILDQLGLQSFGVERFTNTVKLGAYLHDLGKANQDFQDMVRVRSRELPRSEEKPKGFNCQQMVRHEVLSGILATQVQPLRDWLKQYPHADFDIAVCAAMGHHLKMTNKVEVKKNGRLKLGILIGEKDFQVFLKTLGCHFLGLPVEIPQLASMNWRFDRVEQALEQLKDEFSHKFEIEYRLTEEEQHFIAAVKATVLAADLAGSALPKEGIKLTEWIERAIENVLTPKDLQDLLDQRLEGQPLRKFQERIANTSTRVTIVKAGCGTGKTVGAYAWGKKWAIGRKLFFTYPTTGTASQGYFDYADKTEIEATLMHSRAAIDLEYALVSESEDNEAANEVNFRLAAFEAWDKKLIVCTVDTVLGLIQNNRRPLYCWPAIAMGAFVFDEVHSYDKKLFSALLHFLRTFRGAPVLLMSASFTQKQEEEIQKVMQEIGKPPAEVIPGPQDLEELERYELRPLTTVTDLNRPVELWSEVMDALEQEQKVLWVTNSVQTTIDIYEFARQQLQDFPIEPLIYHSRYRYLDRLERHRDIIEAFKPDVNKPVLAITNQVCEMSLDLSADLLITAQASAAALIQRLGRLNRAVVLDENGKPVLKSGRIARALIYHWDRVGRPYSKEELATGEQLVSQLAGRVICQQDLAQVAAQLTCPTPERLNSTWLNESWCTYPDFLREGGSNITVLRDEDLGAIKKAAEEHIAKNKDWTFMQEAQRWAVPVPLYWESVQRTLQSRRRCKFYPVAPAGAFEYDPIVGARAS